MIHPPRPIIQRQFPRMQGRSVNRLASLCLLALLLSGALGQAAPRFEMRRPKQANQAAWAIAARARAPLMFVENVGQLARAARYALYGSATGLMIAEDGIWLTIHDRQVTPARPDTPAAEQVARAVQIKLSFVGANQHPQIEPLEPLDTRISYFTGADSRAWRTAIPAWGGVRYRDLYPGVDLELSGAYGYMDLRMIARQSVDLLPVRLHVDGADTIGLAEHSLRLTTPLGTFALPLLHALAANGGILPFTALLPTLDGAEIAHPFAAPTAPAVTNNPQQTSDLVYSTFYGGSGEDPSEDVVVDTSGAAYVTGYTTSDNFPIVAGAVDLSPSGYNTTIVKVKPDGSGLDFAAVVGGNGIEYGTGIAVDAGGAVYVSGYTASNDFPTTASAYDRNGAGVDKLHRDVFILKLNAAGSSLIYSTYIGGNGDERATDIALDATGAAYVTGSTPSADFPTTVGAYDRTFNGGTDAFVVKLNPSGSSLDYTTYIGGSGNEKGNDITLDSSGAAYVAGWTTSVNFPTVNAYDSSANGMDDVFVSKLNPVGTDLSYSTFLGGSDADHALGIAVDGSGAAYISGYTFSANFPATLGAYDTSQNGSEDAFAAKISPTGATLNYATFLGGSADDESRAIAVDANGAAYVGGFTGSSNFPTSPSAYDISFNGVTDAFMLKLNSAGSGLTYSTFLGGSALDSGDGLTIDHSGGVYVTGEVDSPDFPTTPNAYRTSFGGGPSDAFVAKFQLGTPPPTYTISGHVHDGAPNPIANVTITAGSYSATTGNDGAFQLVDLPAGDYTVIPSKAGATFIPPSSKVTLSANMTLDFTLTTPLFQVSGQVIDAKTGAPLAGVAVSAGAGGATTTGGDGGYSLQLAPGAYTLTPVGSKYTFIPPSRIVNVINADVGGQQFAAVAIQPPKPQFIALLRFATTPVEPPPPLLCDSLEPNDDRTTTKSELVIGQLYQAKLCAQDQDNYFFDIVGTATKPIITLALPPLLRGKTLIFIYRQTNLDPNANICGDGSLRPVSEIRVTNCPVLSPGRYIVHMYADNPATDFDNQNFYTLQVTR